MDTRGMKRAFEILDHTADVGIVAYGRDIEELFCNAALALFSLITEPGSIQEKSHLHLKVSSDERDSLLVEWMNELIYCFDTKHFLFNRFDIESLTQNELKATCHGEDFDPMKHKIKRAVKAATYHMLRLDSYNDGYKARIILDI
jgi:SHS2 domain-containing protein